VNKQLPLVSVCVPVYNGERHLLEALNSVHDQDYENLELIISDDGSTDGSWKVINDFIPKFRYNVKVLSHGRSGLADHLNYCIDNSSGKYIKFVFQDDIIYPTCIREMVNVAEAGNNIGFVFSKRDILCDSSSLDLLGYAKSISDLNRYFSLPEGVSQGVSLLNDPNFDRFINPIGEPTNVLISRRSALEINGFSPRYSQLVDMEMWFRLSALYQIGYIPNSLSAFRVHSSQLTHLNKLDNKSAHEIRALLNMQLNSKYIIFLNPEVVSRYKKLINPNKFTQCRRFIKNKIKHFFKIS